MEAVFFLAFFSPAFLCVFWFFELYFSSGKNRTAKRHLAFFMLCGFVGFASAFLFFFEFFKIYVLLYFIIAFFFLGQIPSYYLYLVSLTEKRIRASRYLKHYAFPLFAMLTLSYCYYRYLGFEDSVKVFTYFFNPAELDEKQRIVHHIELFFRNSFVVFSLIYLILIHRKVKTNLSCVHRNYADVEGKSLHWVFVSNMLFLFFIILGFLYFNPVVNRLIFNPDSLFSVPLISLGVVFWYIGYKGNRQVFIELSLEEKKTEISQVGEIDRALKDKIIKDLKKAMEKEAFYKQSEISLPVLAKEIGTNRYYLSKIINEDMDMSFNTYINTYRIREAVRFMSDKPYVSLKDIAFMFGYTNYSSFTRNFKKIMGKAPEAFRMKVNIQEPEQ